MPTPTTSTQSSYNRIAIRTAETLHRFRTAARAEAASEPRTIDQLFPPHNRVPLGVALEYQRMGSRPVSGDLQARADQFGFDLEHLSTTIGTVIHNVRLQETLSTDLVRFIRDTLLERKVIFFRDQNLTEDEHVSFARYFGDLDAFPFGKPGHNPFILEIIHDENSPGTENGWHTDVTWMERPSLGSIAQCIVVPPVGGDTLFSDSHACFLGLPLELGKRIEYLHGINDYRLFVGRGVSLPEALVAEMKRQIPFGVSHPLLRTHPETGKTGLYIHGGFLRHDSLYDCRTGERLDRETSQDIVRALLRQHERPEYLCRFKWQPGSIAFWDNRAAQHYAASDYFPHKRTLRRVTVSGDAPFYDPTQNVPIELSR